MLNSFVKLSKFDYDNALNKLFKNASFDSNMILWGTFGSVSYPSISDIDLFVCFKDKNFRKSKKELLKIIRTDELLNYLFIHDPLFVSESMLSYLPSLHTLYNLNFTYNPKNYILNKPSKSYLELLNDIWTTFLIPVSLRVIRNRNHYTPRFKILLLKNLHQSLANWGLKDYLNHSVLVRDKVLSNSLMIEELDYYFYIAVNKIIENLHNISQKQYEYTISNQYRLNRTLIMSKSDTNSYLDENRISTLKVQPGIVNMFEQFYYKKNSCSLIKAYKQSAKKVWQISKQTDTFYPFVSPFGFQFYREDLCFKLMKILLRFTL